MFARTMTPLHSKITRRAEIKREPGFRNDHLDGRKYENARLLPLIEALAKVADCADLLSDWAHEDCGLAAALSSLARIVGNKEDSEEGT